MQHEQNQEFILSALDLILRGPSLLSARDEDAPLISVIMPVLDREKLIEASLESLRRQSWRNFEVLIIDDASTDSTGDILRRWAAQHPWLRVFRNDARRGAAASRNIGLSMARGKLIGYLDSDNWLYPHALATWAETFSMSPDIWSIYTSLLWFYEDGRVEARCPDSDLEAIMRGDRAFDLNAFVHRRELYEFLGGFDENLTRFIDWDLIIRYSRFVMPRRISTPTARYNAGAWSRISNRALEGWNKYLVRQRNALTVSREIRALYVVHSFPQVSETYITAEMRFMLSRGIRVEIWSEFEPVAPDRDLADLDEIKVHRGTLSEAISAFKPDIVHIHWLNLFERFESEISGSGAVVTMRGHSFEFSLDQVARLQEMDGFRKLYLFPRQKDSISGSHARLMGVPVGFDPNQYYPSRNKDRRLVVRAGVSLPTKDVESFIAAAARCPEFRFVLCTCRSFGNRTCFDHIQEENQRLGSPVTILEDLPASQVADWVRRAGIYLHSYNKDSGMVGMPISIVEAMATGCYVLARDGEEFKDYLKTAGNLYFDVDQAVQFIRATLDWTDRQWQEVGRRAINRAFGDFSPAETHELILDDWMEALGAHYIKPRSAELLQTVRPGEALRFGLGGHAAEMLRSGFHPAEEWGVWTGEKRATLAFVAAETKWEQVETLALEMSAFTPDAPFLPVTISINDIVVGTLNVSSETNTVDLNIGGAMIRSGALIELKFETPAPRSPRHTGSDDTRFLGVALLGMTLD